MVQCSNRWVRSRTLLASALAITCLAVVPSASSAQWRVAPSGVSLAVRVPPTRAMPIAGGHAQDVRRSVVKGALIGAGTVAGVILLAHLQKVQQGSDGDDCIGCQVTVPVLVAGGAVVGGTIGLVYGLTRRIGPREPGQGR